MTSNRVRDLVADLESGEDSRVLLAISTVEAQTQSYSNKSEVVAGLLKAFKSGGNQSLPDSVSGRSLQALSKINEIYRAHHERVSSIAGGRAISPLIDSTEKPLIRLCEAMLIQGLGFLTKIPAIALEIDLSLFMSVRSAQAASTGSPNAYATFPCIGPVMDLVNEMDRRFTQAVDSGAADAKWWAYALNLLLVRKVEPECAAGHSFEFLETMTRLAAFCCAEDRSVYDQRFSSTTIGGCMAAAWGIHMRTFGGGSTALYPRFAKHGLNAQPERLARHLHKLTKSVIKADRGGYIAPQGSIYRTGREDALQNLFCHALHLAEYGLLPLSFCAAVPKLMDMVISALMDNRSSDLVIPSVIHMLLVLSTKESVRERLRNVCGLRDQVLEWSEYLSERGVHGVSLAALAVVEKVFGDLPARQKQSVGRDMRDILQLYEMTAQQFRPDLEAGNWILEPSQLDRLKFAMSCVPSGSLSGRMPNTLKQVRTLASHPQYDGFFPVKPLVEYVEALRTAHAASARDQFNSVLAHLRPLQETQEARLAELWKDLPDAERAPHPEEAGPSTSAPAAPVEEKSSAPLDCANCGCLPAEGEPKYKLCAGCKQVRYCSHRCQKRHWLAMHREVCKKVQKERADAASQVD